MLKSIDDRLNAGDILIADGSTGAVLMAAGLPAGTPPEIWNVENPEQILQLHQSYLDAGSQIILTNTFGGSRIKLEMAGLGDRTVELNRHAVKLAQKAAGDRAYVAGDIGPTGELMSPMGKLTYERAFEVFKEQVQAQVEVGVDLIWIETMSDLDEARAAVMGAIQTTTLPVFCSLSFGPKGRTMMGLRASQAAQELWALGLAAIGANCGEGIPPVLEALQQMREVLPNAPLIAKPNAGLPRLVGDKTVYDMTPGDFAANAPVFIELGAQILGGCCGSTNEHIAAVATAVSKSKS
ncbi:MAG: homocysteine S-methyltransferase family protein [Anaerolineales bacterium]|nr:homocysteine S-methyltransferase family protein [Anaerolineales bacterium]